MHVGVTGAGGFIGREIVGACSAARISTSSLRLDFEDNWIELSEVEKQLENLKLDVLVHTAAIRKPKTKFELAFNVELPFKLKAALSKISPNARFIHFSSMNVLLSQRNDVYTKTKRVAEEILQETNVTIIRPTLVWSWDSDARGDPGRLIKYLNFPLPLHPAPYPGQVYRPIDVKELAKKIVDASTDKQQPRVINVIGSKPMTLWELANITAKQKSAKLVPIPIEILEKIFPHNLKKRFPALLRTTNGSIPDLSFGKTADTTWELPFELPAE